MLDTSIARQGARALRDRIRPLGGLMTLTDYERVKRTPRYRNGVARFNGLSVAFSDSAGFLHSVQEVFRDKVYQFSARTERPHIIDAGANIGLSVLFFKSLYPQCSIAAYEPDDAIFALLEQNVGSFSGVDVHQAAVWTENTTLTFFRERSLAGSVAADFAGAGDRISVPAVRLRDVIRKKPVDFLKIDIEGAENSVLFDIAEDLDQIEHLFFEYHSPKSEPQRLGEMLTLVADHGFRFSINGTHGSRLPFVEAAPMVFDLQCNVFCFRPRG